MNLRNKKLLYSLIAAVFILTLPYDLRANITEDAADYYVQLGKDAYLRQDLIEAYNDFSKAVKINPQNQEALIFLEVIASKKRVPPLTDDNVADNAADESDDPQKTLAVKELEEDVLQKKILLMKNDPRDSDEQDKK